MPVQFEDQAADFEDVDALPAPPEAPGDEPRDPLPFVHSPEQGAAIIDDAARRNGGGILGRVRAAREKARTTQHRVFTVPGYGDQLAVRYGRTLDFQQVPALVRFGMGAPESLHPGLDALTRACEALLWRDGEKSPWRGLADEARDSGIDVTGDLRFTAQACEVLGLAPADTPAGNLLVIFGEAPSPETAAAAHAAALGDWLAGDSREVTDRVGEDEPTRPPT